VEIKVMANILDKNDRLAAEVNALLSDRGIFVLNLLGSPGSGKTALLERTIAALRDELRLAVIEGDLFTDKDAARIARQGVPVVQINTGGGCHLDANMVKGVLGSLDLARLDLLIIENVGNLVCPAEFNIGEDAKATVLSITEGEDKPLKYPLVFKQASAVVLNKIDLLPYTSFDLAAATEDIASINPGIVLITASCRTGEGLEGWYGWLQDRVAAKKNAKGGKGQ
jgi:hydrogenase nickel incorporation protein HypB